MPIKQSIARAVSELSMLSGDALRRARAARRPRILMYHAIGSHDVDADAFAWQLELIRREFEPIRLCDLLDRLERGQCRGDEVAVTFDDGVRNHLTAAYPALRAAGVPATFFVCPGLIEAGRWIWNMEARARLQALRPEARRGLAAQCQWPSDDVEALVGWAKTLDLDARQAFEQHVRDATREFTPTAEQTDCCAPLTWAQLASLDPALIDIGSHSTHHPILTRLTPEQQRAEIADSRRQLEDRLGRPVEGFCYPNGGNDEQVVRTVRAHYRWAVTTEEDLVDAGADPCRLPRVPAAARKALFLRRLYRPAA